MLGCCCVGFHGGGVLIAVAFVLGRRVVSRTTSAVFCRMCVCDSCDVGDG